MMTRARGRRLALACVFGLVVVGVTAGPSQAHSELTSSDPAANAVLDEPPSSLRLEFSDAIEAKFSTVSLSVASGPAQAVPVGVSGRRLTATVPAGSAHPGKWTAAFRVVSVDGHPISGTIAFTVLRSAAPSTAAATGASPTPSARTPTPTASSAAATSLPPAPARTDPLLPRRRLIYWVEGIVGAMLLLAAGVYFARDRS